MERGVAVRDSKSPDGILLLYSTSEWRSFLAQAKASDFGALRLCSVAVVGPSYAAHHGRTPPHTQVAGPGPTEYLCLCAVPHECLLSFINIVRTGVGAHATWGNLTVDVVGVVHATFS
jgi:hypothetical protein